MSPVLSFSDRNTRAQKQVLMDEPPAKYRRLEPSSDPSSRTETLCMSMLDRSRTPTAIFSCGSDLIKIIYANHSFRTETKWTGSVTQTTGITKNHTTESGFVECLDDDGHLSQLWWNSVDSALKQGTFSARFISTHDTYNVTLDVDFDSFEDEGEKFVSATCTSHHHVNPIHHDFKPLPLDLQQYYQDSVSWYIPAFPHDSPEKSLIFSHIISKSVK